MSSKFAKQYQIPPEFPDILKDFTREVLRNQPSNINEFAAKYFDCLANGLPADLPEGDRQDELPGLSADEVEAIIRDLFTKYDKDQSGTLDAGEFKTLMEDLQERLDFPRDEIYRFLAEADLNTDGVVQYEEFIPLAMDIIKGMYAKHAVEQHMMDLDAQGEAMLVHGMSREELVDLMGSIFERMDENQNGSLNRDEFTNALTSMELGLTRKEVNAIMFEVDLDQDGNISYREFVPFAYNLLQKLASMKLLEQELENDDVAQYLIDLFRAKDPDMTGMLSLDDCRDLLHEARLGLSRMQIYTVIGREDVNSDGFITYSTFIPRAVGLIRSMLSFDVNVGKPDDHEAEDNFFFLLDEAMQGAEVAKFGEFMEKLDGCNLVSADELKAVKNLLLQYGDQVPVEEAKHQAWTLVKTMRRHVV